MPSLNPFRRTQPARPSLRQNAASVAARLARVVRKPTTSLPASKADDAPATIEDAAQLNFAAYSLPDPIKTPHQWTARFADFAMGMHVADRTLRMSKPEVMAFIRDAGERDAELPGVMFKALTSAQETFAGWGKLLDVAESRYIVAGSALTLGEAEQGHGNGTTTGSAPAEAEPTPRAPQEQDDAELLALAPAFDAAAGLYQRRIDELHLVCEAADADGSPGPAPDGPISEWQAWSDRCQEWRERTGVAAVEDAMGEAGRALGAIEDQIAKLPAVTLAGLKLKARVGKRCDEIDVTWPDGLGESLARDFLAYTEAQEASPEPSHGLADRVDFASATLKDLVAIHDTAKLVGEVAQAVVWQGRCKAPSARNPYASTYNAAGELMVWLSDELINVEHLAYTEMKKRQPADRWDRESRLAWIAAPIIQNGDTNETAAFIGELAAFMADEAKG